MALRKIDGGPLFAGSKAWGQEDVEILPARRRRQVGDIAVHGDTRHIGMIEDHIETADIELGLAR